MAHRAQESNQRDRIWTTSKGLSEEERRAGIIRLLAEACCARLRKQGKLKMLRGLERTALPQNIRYDFLRAPDWSATAH